MKRFVHVESTIRKLLPAKDILKDLTEEDDDDMNDDVNENPDELVSGKTDTVNQLTSTIEKELKLGFVLNLIH